MFVYAWRLIVICDYPDTSILKISFWSFLSNTKKGANLPTPMDVHPRKSYQLQGSFAPDPLTRGSCPWTPLGSPSHPRYRLALPRSPWA